MRKYAIFDIFGILNFLKNEILKNIPKSFGPEALRVFQAEIWLKVYRLFRVPNRG